MLLRHGRTGDNASGRIQGQLDTPLDDVGLGQARAVAPLLAAARPSVVLSSDLSRARDTASPLARAAGVDVRLDTRLRELDLGRWQGLTSRQARERFPEEHAAWRAGIDVPRGGGETYAAAGARAVQCLLQAWSGVGPGGVLVAVTHGGTARAATCLLLGVAPDQWWRVGALGNACWTVLGEHRNGWRLERHGAGAEAPTVASSWPVPAGRPVR